MKIAVVTADGDTVIRFCADDAARKAAKEIIDFAARLGRERGA